MNIFRPSDVRGTLEHCTNVRAYGNFVKRASNSTYANLSRYLYVATHSGTIPHLCVGVYRFFFDLDSNFYDFGIVCENGTSEKRADDEQK